MQEYIQLQYLQVGKMCSHMFVFFQGQVNLLKVHVLYTGIYCRVFEYHFLYTKCKYCIQEKNFIFNIMV